MSKRTGDKPTNGEVSERASLNRRRFFMLGGSAVSLAAATPLIGEAQAQESDSDRKKTRYKETEHVKTFYRVNRY